MKKCIGIFFRLRWPGVWLSFPVLLFPVQSGHSVEISEHVTQASLECCLSFISFDETSNCHGYGSIRAIVSYIVQKADDRQQ